MTSKLQEQLQRIAELNNNEFIISIEGSIGAGKSTLIQKITELLPKDFLEVIDEPVSEWQNIDGIDVLKEYYDNPSEYSYAFQTLAFASRVINQQVPLKKNIRITERSVYTDYVFAKILHDENKIDDVKWAIYNNWYIRALKQLLTKKPNLIIYLHTSAENCKKRKDKRNRDGEAGINIEYLRKLEYYHDEWMPELDWGITIEGIIYVRIDSNPDIRYSNYIVNIVQYLGIFLEERYDTLQDQLNKK